jgi:cobalt/nickel transport system permease protein
VGIVAARAAGSDRAQIRTAGALGAAVFAAQLFNLPILPYSSAHLVGGALLAWALGPALGLLSMSVVLTLQALLLGDGGLLALGANIINMALVPAAAVLLLERLGLRNSRHSLWALGAAAFGATLAGAGLITLEVAVGRSGPELDGWSGFAWRMLASHACAGMFEAAATMALVALLTKAAEPRPGRIALTARQATAVGSASAALALFSQPGWGLASQAPDAYQAALAAVGQLGHALGGVEATDRLHGLAAVAQAWQDALAAALPAANALAPALGALLAGFGAALCALASARRSPEIAPISIEAP